MVVYDEDALAVDRYREDDEPRMGRGLTMKTRLVLAVLALLLLAGIMQSATGASGVTFARQFVDTDAGCYSCLVGYYHGEPFGMDACIEVKCPPPSHDAP